MPNNRPEDIPKAIIVPKGHQKLSTKCYNCKHAKGLHTTDDFAKREFQFLSFTNCNKESCDCAGFYDPSSPAANRDRLDKQIAAQIQKAKEEEKWPDTPAKE